MAVLTDPIVIAALIVALAVLAVGFLVLSRRGNGQDIAKLSQATEQLMAHQRSLEGRLSQMAEQDAATQTMLAERLQAQERQIGKALEERLGEVRRHVGDSLEKSTTQTATTIHDLKTRLALIDQAQKNISQLSSQVVGLQDILANKQARGAFGEVQLNDLVRAVLPPDAYDFQASVGGKRADCLLKLPNPPGPIVIDSKFPLESYRALMDAGSDNDRTLASRQFATDVRRHIQAIAEKYIVPEETAESALMFLPSESVYAELHANFNAVVEDSYRSRVWIVSPTTLWATLNTVRAVLKDVRMREQAGVIQKEVRSLLVDVGRLDDRVDKLQTHFNQATDDVRQIKISTNKITKRGERIDDLQMSDGGEENDPLAKAAGPVKLEGQG